MKIRTNVCNSKVLRSSKENQRNQKTVVTSQPGKTNAESSNGVLNDNKQVSIRKFLVLKQRQATSVKTRIRSKKWSTPNSKNPRVGEDFNDPYDFDSFIKAYEKENLSSPEVKVKKVAKTKPKVGSKEKKKRRPPKLKAVENMKKKEGKEVATLRKPRRTTESNDECWPPSKKFNCMEKDSEVGIFRRECTTVQPAHAEPSSLCNEQDFLLLDETAETGQCCTSTPQNTENNLHDGPKAQDVLSSTLDDFNKFEVVSPIGIGSLEKDDPNCSGFVGDRNFRSYKRCKVDVDCNVPKIEMISLPKGEDVGKRKRKAGAQNFGKKFDNWASSVNESLLEAAEFELVIE